MKKEDKKKLSEISENDKYYINLINLIEKENLLVSIYSEYSKKVLKKELQILIERIKELKQFLNLTSRDNPRKEQELKEALKIKKIIETALKYKKEEGNSE